MNGYSLFDAHCHLQDERFAGNIHAVLTRARDKGVGGMMCCGSREGDWERVRELAKLPGVHASFGLHPWYVMERSGAWLQELRSMLDAVPAAGVGEIGLDKAIDDADSAVREDVFISQLRLAREMRRPVSIHCRKAFGRMKDLLETHGRIEHGGVLHSYSGPVEMVPQFERLGLYLSFSGSITHSNNKRGHAAVRATSWERLLIETDSPDILPMQIAPGTCNEPANIVFVLDAIAHLTGMSMEDAAIRTWENACRAYKCSPSLGISGRGPVLK
jgi:TatD DNase family protein